MGLFKNSREIFFQGTPPLTPPCFEKIDPPLAEKKVDPLPWAEGACPPMTSITVNAVRAYGAPGLRSHVGWTLACEFFNQSQKV